MKPDTPDAALQQVQDQLRQHILTELFSHPRGQQELSNAINQAIAAHMHTIRDDLKKSAAQEFQAIQAKLDGLVHNQIRPKEVAELRRAVADLAREIAKGGGYAPAIHDPVGAADGNSMTDWPQGSSGSGYSGGRHSDRDGRKGQMGLMPAIAFGGAILAFMGAAAYVIQSHFAPSASPSNVQRPNDTGAVTDQSGRTVGAKDDLIGSQPAQDFKEAGWLLVRDTPVVGARGVQTPLHALGLCESVDACTFAVWSAKAPAGKPHEAALMAAIAKADAAFVCNTAMYQLPQGGARPNMSVDGAIGAGGLAAIKHVSACLARATAPSEAGAPSQICAERPCPQQPTPNDAMVVNSVEGKAAWVKPQLEGVLALLGMKGA
jgi:hypothetical protein